MIKQAGIVAVLFCLIATGTAATTTTFGIGDDTRTFTQRGELLQIGNAPLCQYTTTEDTGRNLSITVDDMPEFSGTFRCWINTTSTDRLYSATWDPYIIDRSACVPDGLNSCTDQHIKLRQSELDYYQGAATTVVIVAVLGFIVGGLGRSFYRRHWKGEPF